MTFFDILISLIIGAYLIAVAVRGNSAQLWEYAKRDKAFLKWALAVAILAYMYGIKEIRAIAGLLILAAFALFFMRNINPITQNASAFWASLSQ